MSMGLQNWKKISTSYQLEQPRPPNVDCVYDDDDTKYTIIQCQVYNKNLIPPWCHLCVQTLVVTKNQL